MSKIRDSSKSLSLPLLLAKSNVSSSSLSFTECVFLFDVSYKAKPPFDDKIFDVCGLELTLNDDFES